MAMGGCLALGGSDGVLLSDGGALVLADSGHGCLAMGGGVGWVFCALR